MQFCPGPSKFLSRKVFKIDKHFFLLLPWRSLFSASLKLNNQASPSIALCLPLFNVVKSYREGGENQIACQSGVLRALYRVERQITCILAARWRLWWKSLITNLSGDTFLTKQIKTITLNLLNYLWRWPRAGRLGPVTGRSRPQPATSESWKLRSNWQLVMRICRAKREQAMIFTWCYLNSISVTNADFHLTSIRNQFNDTTETALLACLHHLSFSGHEFEDEERDSVLLVYVA